jgi:catechol 1,2-dioxygenase
MTEDNITAAALDRLSAAADPRTREIVAGVIRHLHDCARELRLTPDEWKIGIDFLAAAGHLTDDKRNEFILLSDTLGLSALVDLMSHSGERATASSLLGPFYREGVPEFEFGASIAGETPGEPLIVRGLIADAAGRPLAGAMLDIWQAAPNGMYDLQDSAQP